LASSINHIFIVGAARSGTHLLSTMLRSRVDCAYAGEINHLWQRSVGHCHHDMFSASMANESGEAMMRSYFERLGRQSNKSVVLEKTAANSLRMPYIYRLFPDAAFINIVRDGRDVAISARRKYLGDTRKVTSVNCQAACPSPPRHKLLRTMVRQKLSSGASLSELMRYLNRYTTGALNATGLAKQAMWGPRFPGMKELFNSHSLLEVAGLQWRASMEALSSFTESNPSVSMIEVNFEELISDPADILNKIIDFLGDRVSHCLINNPEGEVVPLKVASSWRNLLQGDELYQLHALILATLQKYGYPED
jgi:hypothetical protein